MPGIKSRKVIAAAVILAALLAIGLLLRRNSILRRAGRPNIIIVIIDTLRRDHVGAYGYERATTPTIDKLAQENVLFANAYANSNWTKPSIASLFTGLYVSQHGVKRIMTSAEGEAPASQALPGEAVTIAEVLHEAGYNTVGVVENVHVSEKLGFAQGFDVWEEGFYGAANVTGGFLDHLADLKEPFFAYIHYFDPHTPYYRNRFFEGEGGVAAGVLEAKTEDNRWYLYTFGVDRGFVGLTPLERERLISLYDGEIRDVDIGLARIFAALRRNGLFRNCWIIVTSDHGENFYEGKRLTHPHDCFQNPQVRVPLIMKLPDALGLGDVVVGQAVQHTDVAPTIISYLGLPHVGGMPGLDLMAAVGGGRMPREAPLVGESESAAMLVSGPSKYVRVRTRVGTYEFVYDLSSDPFELVNLADSTDSVRARLAAQFERVNEAARSARAVEAAEGIAISVEEMERLRSLGYGH